MRKPSKKLAVLIGAAALVAVGGGVAFAYWSSTGTGTGSGGTNASAQVVSITQTSTVTGMGPGVAAQTLSGTFTTAKPAYVGQVHAVVSGTSNAGCTASDFTVVDPAVTNAEVSTGSTWGAGTIVFKDSATTNQDLCKGVTVNLTYTSN